MDGLATVILGSGSAVSVYYALDAISLRWGRIDSITEAYFAYLSKGFSVKDAVGELYTYLRRGHGITADWPKIEFRGDGTFTI
jgi:hypothetical protein